jgi:hypothetical protein
MGQFNFDGCKDTIEKQVRLAIRIEAAERKVREDILCSVSTADMEEISTGGSWYEDSDENLRRGIDSELHRRERAEAAYESHGG